MREPRTDHGKHSGEQKVVLPNFTKPVWKDQQTTCKQCIYGDQDIDTCPCANCHTRH